MARPGTHEQDPIGWCLLISFGFLALCLIRLAIPTMPMFDETHYLPAARAWLTDGTWVNREHPMLAKTILAGQIALLGDNSLAWRIVPALMGALALHGAMRALWFASQLRFATIAYGVLLFTGFCLFVNARIAMLDIYMLGFFMLALWQLAGAFREPETARWRLPLTGVAMGLSLACKWNLALLLPLPGLLFFALRAGAQRRRLFTSRRGRPIPGVSLAEAFLYLGILPLAVYWLSYAPAWFAPHDPLNPFDFVGLHRSMLELQESVKESHPYQSVWWQWVLDLRSIWYLYEPVDGAQRGIVMLGNPFTMLLGLPALLWALFVGLARRRWDALAVAVLYVVSLGSWIVADKPVQFYYHYLAPSCFLLAALALALDALGKRRGMRWPVAVLALSVALFVFFYPILSAAPLAGERSFTHWTWIDGWR